MLVLVQNQLYASAFGETAHIFFMFQNQLLHNAVMRSWGNVHGKKTGADGSCGIPNIA